MSNERKKRLKERAQKTRIAAHQRVIKDGTVQFRLDAENMERLLGLADQKRTGAGVLARMWVLERLNKELGIVTQEEFAAKSLNERLMQLQIQIDSLSKVMKTTATKRAKAS